MALSEFFLNNFETSDNALDQRLKPHYYNNDYHTTQHLIIIIMKCYLNIKE